MLDDYVAMRLTALEMKVKLLADIEKGTSLSCLQYELLLI
jgi:hypothetical protein